MSRTVFQRARDKCRRHTLVARRLEIVVVGGNHQDFFGLETEKRDGRSIRVRPRFVAAGILCGDDAVPREPGKSDD